MPAQAYTKPTIGDHVWAESANVPADLINLDDATIAAGWPLSGVPPSRQRFNFILRWLWRSIRYLLQRGISDWDAGETYSVGSVCIGPDGYTYRSSAGGNVGQNPVGSAYWDRWALTLVQINGSQLLQANVATGDASTKVANTNFVAAAIAQVQTWANGIFTTMAAVQAWVNSLGLATQAWVNSLGLATQAWVIAQIAAIVIPTFSKGSNGNGYWEKNNTTGLIRQWGHATAAGGVSFPIAFTNAASIIVTFGSANWGSGATRNVVYQASDATTVGFAAQTDSSSAAYDWQAIGY